MAKIAIVLHAQPGTKDSLGRALHSLLYSQELKDSGHEVRLVLDGGGTGWAVEWNKEDHPLHPVFKEVKKGGLSPTACEYCIGAFEVDQQKVKEAGVSPISEYKGHPSVARLIGEGFQVITL